MAVRQNVMKIIEVDGYRIEYRKKNVKNINMRIRTDGSIAVSAPYHVAERDVVGFIRDREEWLRNHMERVRAAKRPEKRWVSGENFYLFGRKYRLLVVAEQRVKNCSFEIRTGEAVFHVTPGSTPEQRQRFAKRWYKEALETELTRMVSFWEQRTGLYSSGFRIRDMKSRWGSCNTATRMLCFNLQLVQYDRSLIEYVVMHELAHIEVPNHSSEFWDLVSEYMPDWKERRDALRDRGTTVEPSGDDGVSV